MKHLGLTWILSRLSVASRLRGNELGRGTRVRALELNEAQRTCSSHEYATSVVPSTQGNALAREATRERCAEGCSCGKVRFTGKRDRMARSSSWLLSPVFVAPGRFSVVDDWMSESRRFLGYIWGRPPLLNALKDEACPSLKVEPLTLGLACIRGGIDGGFRGQGAGRISRQKSL